MCCNIFRFNRIPVQNTGPAILVPVAVEHFLPLAGKRYTDPEIFRHGRRQVQDHQIRHLLFLVPTDIRDNALLNVAAIDPLESGR